MKRLLASIAVVVALASPARADMFDYFFKFTNEAQAKAAAEMLAGHYDTTIGWLFSHVVTNVQAWRPSQDVSGTDAEGKPKVTHTYLTGWFAIVSIESPAPIPLLMNAGSLQFAINRTKLDAGQTPFVVKNNIAGVITDVAVSPITSPNYPIGGLN